MAVGLRVVSVAIKLQLKRHDSRTPTETQSLWKPLRVHASQHTLYMLISTVEHKCLDVGAD